MGNKLVPHVNYKPKRYNFGTDEFLYFVPPEESLIGELPDELWIRVFKFFNMRDLVVVQFACRSTFLKTKDLNFIIKHVLLLFPSTCIKFFDYILFNLP